MKIHIIRNIVFELKQERKEIQNEVIRLGLSVRLMAMRNDALVVAGDSTVTTTGTTCLDPSLGDGNSVSLRVRVHEDEQVGEDDLGGHVENGVGDDLCVDGDAVGTFSQGEDDGVGRPEDDGEEGSGGVNLLNGSRLELCG
jgi:hypothetical protein